MSKQFSVSALCDGCVLDHIQPGLAIKILQVLGLHNSPYQIMVGIHLSSQRMVTKDIIKAQDYSFSSKERDIIAVLSNGATLNTIKNFQVTEKKILEVPQEISEVFACQNIKCISNDSRSRKSIFRVEHHRLNLRLVCRYCDHALSEKMEFARDNH